MKHIAFVLTVLLCAGCGQAPTEPTPAPANIAAEQASTAEPAPEAAPADQTADGYTETSTQGLAERMERERVLRELEAREAAALEAQALQASQRQLQAAQRERALRTRPAAARGDEAIICPGDDRCDEAARVE